MQHFYVLSFKKGLSSRFSAIFSLVFFAFLIGSASSMAGQNVRPSLPSQDWEQAGEAQSSAAAMLSAVQTRLAMPGVSAEERDYLIAQSHIFSAIQAQLAAGGSVESALEKGVAAGLQAIESDSSLKGFDRQRLEPLFSDAFEQFIRTEAIPAIPQN